MDNVIELDTPGPTITEDCQPVNLRDLARSVIAQAVRDLKRQKDPVRSVDALLWLTDENSTFSLFAEIMNAPYLDPYKLLCSGNAKKLVGKL